MNQSILLGGLALMAATAWSVPGGTFEDRYPWLSDLDQARALAASQQKPLLIVFRCEP